MDLVVLWTLFSVVALSSYGLPAAPELSEAGSGHEHLKTEQMIKHAHYSPEPVAAAPPYDGVADGSRPQRVSG